jgi:hypothetical protein
MRSARAESASSPWPGVARAATWLGNLAASLAASGRGYIPSPRAHARPSRNERRGPPAGAFFRSSPRLERLGYGRQAPELTSGDRGPGQALDLPLGRAATASPPAASPQVRLATWMTEAVGCPRARWWRGRACAGLGAGAGTPCAPGSRPQWAIGRPTCARSSSIASRPWPGLPRKGPTSGYRTWPSSTSGAAIVDGVRLERGRRPLYLAKRGRRRNLGRASLRLPTSPTRTPARDPAGPTIRLFAVRGGGTGRWWTSRGFAATTYAGPSARSGFEPRRKRPPPTLRASRKGSRGRPGRPGRACRGGRRLEVRPRAGPARAGLSFDPAGGSRGRKAARCG